ncbi:MAG: hypothetical protein Q9161_002484 [Pseudevernia consocians]
MASLGKMATSVLSATNENTLALGSLKLDFSIIKYEAPVEFSGLGAALSTRRRTDAEDGLHHKTARRLAALFEQLIPSTPKLITAYGLRSSEIIQTPGVNPKGSSKHGPFESFVGADGTAMWAAATSGVPALGVYLLACLLARAWDAKEAISIWVELVEQRRKVIGEEFKSNYAVSESSLNSIRQNILREDLARWDASARAWLLSADQAKIKEQTQLMLVIKNCQLPFNGGESTYSKVIQSWQQALSGLENLLCGKPQEISNHSIMLAFSAWHLYPNLIVLGNEVRNVTFDDPLVDQRGVGTIALQPRSATANQGTAWSLTLSHLRYYGDPVTVRSHGDFSRVTIEELHVIALGSILGTWGVGQRDVLPVLQWFVDLWEFLKSGSSLKDALSSLDFLGYLAKAARRVLLTNTSNKPAEHQLLAYGQRRAKRFLGVSKERPSPFFGLAEDSILAGLAEEVDEERAIAYLRTFAMRNSYHSSDAYICSDWSNNKVLPADMKIREYMTAVPHTCASRKRDADGNQMTEAIHARWLYHGVEQCLQGSKSFVDKPLKERLQYIAARGERGTRIRNAPYGIPREKDWAWENPPLLYNYHKQHQLGYTPNSPYCCPSLCFSEVVCRCFDCDTTEQGQGPSMFSPVWSIGEYSIFVNDSQKEPTRSAIDNGIELWGGRYVHPTISAKMICRSSIKADTVSEYLRRMMNPAKRQSRSPPSRVMYEDDQGGQQSSDDEEEKSKEWYGWRDTFRFDQRADPNFTKLHSADIVDTARISYTEELADKWPMSKTQLRALKGLNIATHVYLQLDGATISLKAVETPLNNAPWITKHDTSHSNFSHLTRSSTLACIAHFESGTLLPEPDELDQTLAIASGNSIFVIGALISDPFEKLAASSVKRIIGNIGRTGICMLVAPFEPKVRPLGNEYNLVEHAAYDRKREDNFKGTSLHLGFTDWTLPLEVKGAEGRTIDQEAYIVESVISVLDCGKWVADLDILCIDFEALTRLRMSHQCPGHPDRLADYDYTSLDSWEELLDGPMSVGFFRAHGNWAARLAAVSILSQKDQAHCIGLLGPETFCLECLGSDHDSTAGLKKFESPLPSICID